MSKLLSCFWQNKKSRDNSPHETVARSRRISRGDDIVYIDPGAGKHHRFSDNVRQVYRTETVSQSPNHEKLFGPDNNRLSRSYPVSPERRSLYKVYSFEQRPSLEKQRFVNKRDSSNLMIYAANVTTASPQLYKTTDNNSDILSYEIPVVNLPRRSVLNYGVDYEKELGSKERPLCKAEKPAEDYHKPISSEDKSVLTPLGKDKNQLTQGNERRSTLQTSNEDNQEFVSRRSNMENQNLLYLTGNNMSTEPKIAVVKARPPSGRLGGSVKLMTYRAEDVGQSPMSARRYVHQMPLKVAKTPPVLTTANGRLLVPIQSNTVKRIPTKSSNETKPVKLSAGGFPLAQGGEAVVAAPMIMERRRVVEGFPLAHGQEVVVAAPMIGGGGKVKKGGKAQKSKSILRKGKGGKAPYANELEDDYYDDYMDERDYRQPYYDDGLDMSYFSPAGGGYGPGGGYYDDGYGYSDEPMGGYGGAPGYSRGGRSARQQIYAAQIPDMTLPVTSEDKGKNPPFKKTAKSLDAPQTCGNINYSDLKNEKPVSTKPQLTKGSKAHLISSAQQTDLANDLNFICFSPERFFNATEVSDDPNSKLRWRIVIKRADEE